jgi:hypothetical protein
MSLARLIYKSTAKEKATLNQGLKALEDQASSNNADRNITGLLILTGDSFLQVLEGDPIQLTSLFRNIVNDKRHADVELVTFESVAQRSFEQWGMRLIDLYDIPGDMRRTLASKYQVVDDHIAIPTDIYQVYALLFDAKNLCLSAPWKDE